MNATETVSYIRDTQSSVGGAEKLEWRHGLGSYRLADTEMASGSTLGAPKVCAVIKASGGIEKVYSTEAGAKPLGSFTLQYWDASVGMRLTPLAGHFTLHPEHQEHAYMLSNGDTIHEDVFVLNGGAHEDGSVDSGALYIVLELTNDSTCDQEVGTYAFCEIDGAAKGDVVSSYDSGVHGLLGPQVR